MKPAAASNSALRFALAVILGGACRTPLPAEQLALELSARALPGVGAGLALAQRVYTQEARRFDFELGIERQELADAGARGDDWSRIWAGLRCAPPERASAFQLRAGVTWVRSEGETDALGDPGDYGGAYLGGGYDWELSPTLATGPELSVLWVDSEGDASGSGLVAELAWRWTWHL